MIFTGWRIPCIILLIFLAVICGCKNLPQKNPIPPHVSIEIPTNQPSLEPVKNMLPSPTPEKKLRFAVIGDYGIKGEALQQVATMVAGWSPDLIITTGDNNYPDGSPKTIDENIGQYFHEFIAPYQGAFGAGAEKNRFFPSLGNHDWNTDHAKAYLDYFTLPGNERYYDLSWDPVHFFMLDSDTREPDGVGRSSIQAQWLQTNLASSTLPWKIIVSHYSPYSSGFHGSTDWMQWPFKEWGASIVISGHDHDYERLLVDGFPYLVDGLGGSISYPFQIPIPGSQMRHSYDHCAIWAEATSEWISFELRCVPGIFRDSLTLDKVNLSFP